MRIRWLLFAVLLAVALSGCLQVRTLLRVFPDGSGQIVYTLQMRSDAFDQLKSLSAMGGESKEPYTLIDEKALRAQAAQYGDGVVFEGVKALDGDDGPGYVATYRVPDVEALALPAFPEIVMPDSNADASDEDPVTFTFEAGAFETGSPALLTIRMPEPMGDDEVEAVAAKADTLGQDDLAELQRMRTLFRGMRFATVIRPEGTLLDTDASYNDDGTITLAMLDFEDLLADPAAIQALQGSSRPTSPAEFRERVADLEGLEMETAPTVTVTFEGE